MRSALGVGRQSRWTWVTDCARLCSTSAVNSDGSRRALACNASGVECELREALTPAGVRHGHQIVGGIPAQSTAIDGSLRGIGWRRADHGAMRASMPMLRW